MLKYLKSLFFSKADAADLDPSTPAELIDAPAITFAYSVPNPTKSAFKEITVYLAEDKAVATGRYEVYDEQGERFDYGQIQLTLSDPAVTALLYDSAASPLVASLRTKLGFAAPKK